MTLKAETTVRMGLMRKKDSWTSADFNAYWRDKHGPLAAKIPNLREYWQNPVIDRLQRGIDFARGSWDFDGFSQLWFDDAMKADVAFNHGPLSDALITDVISSVGCTSSRRRSERWSRSRTSPPEAHSSSASRRCAGAAT